MTQSERLDFLIRELLHENPIYQKIPSREQEKKALLRALFNRRPPLPAAEALLKVQDNYLQEEQRQRGVTDAAGLRPLKGNLCLWRGDITTLRVDGIVNAANSSLLGCFVPGHDCIDNAIHTWAGIQLRLACAGIMKRQGHAEPPGCAKLTPGFNLPCGYVLHTVGPIVSGGLTDQECDLLASCYRSCLALAEEKGLQSLAFCCISTGEFRFPNDRAAEIAVETVEEYLVNTKSKIKVIFNVFKENDYKIYRRLLTTDKSSGAEI